MKNAHLSDDSGKAGDEYDSPDSEFGFIQTLPLIRSKPNYFWRDTSCDRCGGHWFRNNRRDCRECRKQFAHSWSLVCKATRAVIFKGAFPMNSAWLIGSSYFEFREFLESGCKALGVRINAYGREWGIYHIRPLAEFPLSRQLNEANTIDNLQIRKLHNRPQQETEPVEGYLFDPEKL